MELNPGYKHTEVGTIPNDWEVRSIRDLGRIQTGPFGTLLKAEEYSGRDGVPLVSVGEIGDGTVNVGPRTPLVPDTVVLRLPQYVLRKGDIVFGRKGAVERSALITDAEDGWFLGSDGIAIRPGSSCHPPYLARQFQRQEVRAWLLQNAVGTTMASLNQEVLARVSIPYAPVVEQHKISDVLSDVDALLLKLDQLIAKKRDTRQAVAQALLTGRNRLPEFTGKWLRIQLRDCATFFKGRGLSKADLDEHGTEPCIHYGELFTDYPETISAVRSRTSWTDGAMRAQANDVLMPTSDVTPTGLARASCLLNSGVILGGDILVIRPDPSIMNGSFLSYVIRNSKARVLQLVTGTTVFHLYGSNMMEFEISLPPTVKEQEAIVSILNDLAAEITTLQARCDKFRLLKQGMMQELLTGRIRLV